ncbi:MAG: serine hydrolase [Anaerolineales bacterium]|jgi:CubicO group peptidase (beta-lactamase class C family)
MKSESNRVKRHSFKFPTLLILAAIGMLVGVTACGPSEAELAAVDYTPTAGGDWEVSTPEEQGLDPNLVARLYLDAEEVVTIRSLLVIKNGKLIAEKYFHDGSVDSLDRVQSVTKSVTSALVGIAIEQGCLASVDQKAIDFFPELTSRIQDPRKFDITVQQLLQMRAGFPWEESSAELFELMYSGFRPSVFADVPLVRDPGTGMEYSNISSYLLSVIISRACKTDTYYFAKEHLFAPLGIERSDWIRGWEGYYGGHADLFLRPRDMARFGLLYLDEGVFSGEQLVPAPWVHDSLGSYSEDAWPYRIGSNYKDMEYGYQWWSARAGDRRWNFAWGHGGQQIALLEDLDMVIVVTADPLVGAHGDEPWKYEKQNLNLVADFIADLPDQP